MLTEEDVRHLVDALVRTLGGEDDRDEQLVRGLVEKGGLGIRIEAGKLR